MWDTGYILASEMTLLILQDTQIVPETQDVIVIDDWLSIIYYRITQIVVLLLIVFDEKKYNDAKQPLCLGSYWF